MIKFFLATLILLSNVAVTAQINSKPDLYLLFKVDSTKGFHKEHIKSDAVLKNGAFKSLAYDNDIYSYSYTSPDRTKKYHLQLFSTLNRNSYCVKDSIYISQNIKLTAYNNLQNIRGLIADDWNSTTTSFNKVFIVEKIDMNQFKIIEVTLYLPFSSNAVRVERLD